MTQDTLEEDRIRENDDPSRPMIKVAIEIKQTLNSPLAVGTIRNMLLAKRKGHRHYSVYQKRSITKINHATRIEYYNRLAIRKGFLSRAEEQRFLSQQKKDESLSD